VPWALSGVCGGAFARSDLLAPIPNLELELHPSKPMSICPN
jgi:hypothetical protein